MNNLPIFRNELKNRIVAKYKLIGIISELILSFEVFKRNSDIELFIKQTFNMKFKPYVYKSRTLIVSRVVRLVSSADEEKLRSYKTATYQFIETKLNSDEQH